MAAQGAVSSFDSEAQPRVRFHNGAISRLEAQCDASSRAPPISGVQIARRSASHGKPRVATVCSRDAIAELQVWARARFLRQSKPSQASCVCDTQCSEEGQEGQERNDAHDQYASGGTRSSTMLQTQIAVLKDNLFFQFCVCAVVKKGNGHKRFWFRTRELAAFKSPACPSGVLYITRGAARRAAMLRSMHH